MTSILVGDVRDVLPTLPDQSVQCVVTSPPYWGLRDYGVAGQIGLEATPEAFVETMVGVFREVRRVLRDDGTLWLNIGDSYASSVGETGRRDQNGYIHGRPVGRSGESAASVQDQHRPNRRVKQKHYLKSKDLVGIPWRLAFALQADGWYLRADIIWAKGLSFCDSYSGSVMPESVTDRPTKGHEYVFLLTKSARYFYDAEAVREGFSDDRMGNPGAYKSSYVNGPDGKGVRGSGGNKGDFQEGRGWNLSGNASGRNLRSVWAINPQPFSEAHFATFPMALVEPMIKAGSRVGDTVLDPFAGSGTTGIVALRLGRRFVGIELSDEYADMARLQIQGPLFATTAESASAE